MLFRLNIYLSEEDYLAFNIFHAIESEEGKRIVRKSRRFFVLLMAVLAVLIVRVMELSVSSLVFAGIILLFTVFYMMFFKKLMAKNVKKQLERIKKTGKLPYDPVSTMEFYDDKMVEITELTRIDKGYNALERICVYRERYILAYHSSVGAYIFPVEQVEAQMNRDEFMSFLLSKCSRVEYY
ncbi:MAG: hypothetical protein IKV79_03855 [Oscillospiraceae bacterium]|nr:hypothetical protein [Oscillospiraceae bacterium]